jgi:hypothetical protein
MELTETKLRHIILQELNISYAADEEEVREWHDMIERDMLALRETLTNANEAMGILHDYQELGQLSEFLDQTLEVFGEGTEEEDYEESRRRAYDREESEARRNPKPPMTPEEHEEYMSLYGEEEQEDLPETEIDWHSTLPEKYK